MKSENCARFMYLSNSDVSNDDFLNGLQAGAVPAPHSRRGNTNRQKISACLNQGFSRGSCNQKIPRVHAIREFREVYEIGKFHVAHVMSEFRSAHAIREFRVFMQSVKFFVYTYPENSDVINGYLSKGFSGGAWGTAFY